MSQIDQLPRLGVCAGKTVKHGLKASRERPEGGQCVVPAIPLVNHNIELKSGGKLKLPLKEKGLATLDLHIGLGEFPRAGGGCTWRRGGFCQRGG